MKTKKSRIGSYDAKTLSVMAIPAVRSLWPRIKNDVGDEDPRDWLVHQAIVAICVRDEWAGPRCGCSEKGVIENVFDKSLHLFSAIIVMECAYCSASWLWARP